MPYLPVSSGIVNDAAFPEALSRDLDQDIQLIEECWRVNYTLIKYRNLMKAATPVQTPDEISGEAGTTQYDPVWREIVPRTQEGQDWEQPHLSLTHDATDQGIFHPDVELHAQMRREAREYELKRWGFDKIRDLLVTIPLSFLDAHDITVEPGDVLVWDDDEYLVKQFKREGWWKNTNVRLYVVLNCEHRKLGS
jgi:hypothetical protein